MKFVLGVFILLSFIFLASGKQDVNPVCPNDHAELAYKYSQKQGKDAEYLRYLSYYHVKDAAKRVKTMRFWINQLHLETATSFANEVPGSDGLLFAIDLRDFGWSKEAFSAVARREPYFVQPAVDNATALLLRKMIGIEQDTKSFHAEAIVRADWFFRETMESDRSSSYYDLLFSRFRFPRSPPAGSEWSPAGKNADGSAYPAGYYLNNKCVLQTPEPITSGKFVKFPKNEADFERIFAVDKFREHLKEFKIDTRHGAVVEGMENGVSIVARQNRLVERIITSMGSYYKTFDVKETSGTRDFAETLNKDFEFDAGEILTDLPAGGMAALLVDSKGNIVEVADNRFATDTSDLKFDSRVRTPGSCFICHEQKFITPRNLVTEMLKAGIDIKFKNKRDAIDAKGFFLDWEDKLEHEQTRFSKFIARTSGFKAGENAANIKAWRDEYDSPVSLTVAAKEIGVTEDVFKLVGSKSTKARIAMLLKGMTIPRRTWEKDGYKEIVYQLDASKK